MIEEKLLQFMRLSFHDRIKLLSTSCYYTNDIVIACFARIIGEDERKFDKVELLRDSVETTSKLYQWYKQNEHRSEVS